MFRLLVSDIKSPTDHFLGSQVSLLLMNMANYVYGDHARTTVSLRRLSPMFLARRTPVVLLLICTSIAAHPSTIVSVYVPWRLWVKASLALHPSAVHKEGRDTIP